MELTRLSINNFRNINALKIEPARSFNVFFGDNGAGKTSILEAIHCLSQGKSFRPSSARDLIARSSEAFQISGETLDVAGNRHVLGVERSRAGLKARLDFRDVDSIGRLAEQLPVISIHPGSFSLITGEPRIRRGFMDWGLFFSDPEFRRCWPRYQAALKQRNAALKQRYGGDVVQHWDPPLAECGEIIAQARQRYIDRVNQTLPQAAAVFDQTLSLSLDYRRGWDEQPLAEVLATSVERDRKLGFTFSGPHRADFSCRFHHEDASRFASRGQIKLMTMLLKLVQAELYRQSRNQSCILLLDDLSSELDRSRLSALMEAFSAMEIQCFVTSVERNDWLFGSREQVAMFHVKHGEINRE